MSDENVELVTGFATFVMVVSLVVAMFLALFGRFEQTMAMLAVALGAALVVCLLSLADVVRQSKGA